MKKVLLAVPALVAGIIVACGCGSAPAYKGDGIHCSGGDWSRQPSNTPGPVTSEDNSIMDEIEGWIGTPYLYGGENRSGIDCSAFTQTIYRSVNIDIPRTASQQAAAAQPVSPGELKFGDLIFFNTSGSGISHVGIYIGNGFFAHASSSRGVVLESLSKDYYAERIVSAGRFMQ